MTAPALPARRLLRAVPSCYGCGAMVTPDHGDSCALYAVWLDTYAAALVAGVPVLPAARQAVQDACAAGIAHDSRHRALAGDVRVLGAVLRDLYADPTTWAWDTHDELPGLACVECGSTDTDDTDALDADRCRCGSDQTARVITARGVIVRPVEYAGAPVTLVEVGRG